MPKNTPETYSSNHRPVKVYSGKYLITDTLPAGAGVPEMTVGDALLSPTRTYAPIVRDILAEGARAYTGLSTAPAAGSSSAGRSAAGCIM